MARFNLTQRQMEVARKLVAASRSCGTEEFMHLSTYDGEDVQFHDDKNTQVPCSDAELRALSHAGLVDVVPMGSGGWNGCMRQSIFDAVDTDFRTPDPVPTIGHAGQVNFGHISNSTLNAAVGPRAKQQITYTGNQSEIVAQLAAVASELAGLMKQLADSQEHEEVARESAAVTQELHKPNPDGATLMQKARAIGRRLSGWLDVGLEQTDRLDKVAAAIEKWSGWIRLLVEMGRLHREDA